MRLSKHRGTRRLLHPGLLALSAATAMLLSSAPAAHAAGLDREIRERAPKWLDYLTKNGHKSVGVLKFRVKKGDSPMSDNVGPINMSVADRIEIALVLANPNEDLGIIQRASEALMRAGNRRANHLTPEGRAALFQTRLPLAWGTNKVKADCFFTGEIHLSPDMMTTTVKLLACSSGRGALEQIDEFSSTTDVRTLTESGESFVRRGAFDRSTTVITSAKKVQAKEVAHALESSPVELKVRYDGVAVPTEIIDGVATIVEPVEGQEVTMHLENKGTDTFGVVLKCNGLNTLFKEKKPAADCHKWILDPGDRVTVRGYQMSDDTLVRFRVMSAEETRDKEMNYNPDVGTLSLTIFERQQAKVALEEEEIESDPPPELVATRAVSQATYPDLKPGSLNALKGRLRATGNTGSSELLGRNLVTSGEEVEGSIRRVKFKAGRQPTVSATIVYKRRD